MAQQQGQSSITKYMRRLLDLYHSQLMGKKKDAGCMEFWDAVVLTATDGAQKSAFVLQIEDKKLRRELPLDLPVHVVSDPPGIRVGNGGSTLTALEFLEGKYGSRMFQMKILLIHAGGWSQRMPSATILGKTFSILPHGTPPFQMLDLKLALYWPFVPRMNAGIFLVCADDFLVFNLGDDDNEWTLPKCGFTALAHPSSIAVGRTHGVFVISQEEKMDTSKHVQLLECAEILQKPNDVRMKSQGALLTGTVHEFADGIVLEGETVYTDSCFYFGTDVVEKFLAFKKSVGDLNCEIDAYGDFLQAVGQNATCDYIHNTSNVSQPTDNLIEMRKKVFDLLNGCDVHVLALNASAFIHIGTTKELIHHLCRDQEFQDQMAFGRKVFNMWFNQADSESLNDKNGKVEQILQCNPEQVSENCCIVHCALTGECKIEDDCVLEFCEFEIPVQTSKNCILSNCQLSKSEANLDDMKIPGNSFLHTVPIHISDDVTKYVTVFFRVDDNLKKAMPVKDVELLPFLGSDIGHYLKLQGLDVENILPEYKHKGEKDSKREDKTINHFSQTEKISLWKLKLYPACSSMTSSMENALLSLNAEDQLKKPKLTRKLYSLEDLLRLKNIKEMLTFRKNLYDKIKRT